MCMHLKNIGFHPVLLVSYKVGLYITIHPHFFIIIIQSHNFAAENYAIGNIVKYCVE